MSRKTNNIITIQKPSELRTNYAYTVQVKSFKIDKKKSQLKIVLKNLDPTQYGRLHTVLLPLPAYPGNPVCLLLACFDIDTSHSGTQINLNSLLAKTLYIKFLNTETTIFDHVSVIFIKIK